MPQARWQLRSILRSNPPSDEEIRENNAMCLDVVWGDPLTERELYWPHSCPTGMITQDIGL
jgi:hypothetical protein